MLCNIGAVQPTLLPSIRVVHLGSDPYFYCHNSACIGNCNAIEWLINGTALNTLQLSYVSDSCCWSYLFLRNVSMEYNSTSIQCTNGLQLSENSTLLVQGIMSGGTYPCNGLSFLIRCGEKREG